MSPTDIEKVGTSPSEGNIDRTSRIPPEPALKLDRQGLPLIPQPSDHPDDPLNWPRWQKVYISLLISILVFMAQASAATYNPAFVVISKELEVTVVQASYMTTIFILFSGISALPLVPFANVYGRRPMFVVFTIIAALGTLVTACAPTYGGVIAGRVIAGIGSSVPLALGPAVLVDLWNQGERGLWVGIYTLLTTQGPHIAPIAGGYIAQRLGWRWCLYIPGIIQATLWVLILFTLPETLFARKDADEITRRTYFQKLLFHGKVINRPVRTRDFFGSLRMVRYLAVLFPAIWWMTNTTYGSAAFAVTGSHIGNAIYKFNLEQTGLFMGVPLTVGNIIGEASAGWVSDAIINAYARRHNGYRKPEARLYLLPLCTVLGIGTATFGYCVQTRKPWIDAAVCMAISGFGSQVGVTMVYTYTTDAYKPQSGEIGSVLNLFKALFSFNIGFYALPFSESTGYDLAFSTFAAINLVLLLPILLLLWKGESIRMKQGQPIDHADL